MYRAMILISLAIIGCNSNSSDPIINTMELPPSVKLLYVDDNRTPDTGYMPGYTGWLEREFPDGKPSSQDGIVNTIQATAIAQDIFNRITWKEKSDPWYWCSSTETESQGFGNCIDIAIDIYVALRNAGFSDMNIGIAHLEKDGKGHSVPCLFIEGKIILMDTSDRSDWTLIQTWNIFGCWRHDV